MKHIFTLIVLVAFSFGTANAQSKTETSRTKEVKEKAEFKKAQPAAKATLSQKLEKGSANAKRMNNVMTQQQIDARKEEMSRNPKKSTKPNASKN